MVSTRVTGDKGTLLSGEEGPDDFRGLRPTQVEVPRKQMGPEEAWGGGETASGHWVLAYILTHTSPPPTVIVCPWAGEATSETCSLVITKPIL